MLLFGAQIWLEQRCARRLFLMSPVFLLALVGLVAFTLLPNAIYAALQPFHDHQPGSSFWEAPTGPRCSPISVAGGGWILAFCAAGLAVHGILALVTSARTTPSISLNPDPRGGKARTAYGLSGYSDFCSSPRLSPISSVHDDKPDADRRGAGSGIFALFLLHCALDRSRIRLMPVVLLIVFNLTVMVLAHGGKIPVLIGLAAGLYYIAHTRVSWSSYQAVLAFAVVLVIGMQLSSGASAQIMGPATKWRSQKIGNVFLPNCCGGRRKPDTVCPMFSAQRMTASSCQPDILVEILIPRAVWPEKPNFSLAADMQRFTAE